MKHVNKSLRSKSRERKMTKDSNFKLSFHSQKLFWLLNHVSYVNVTLYGFLALIANSFYHRYQGILYVNASMELQTKTVDKHLGPANNYMFKVNNRNTRTSCKIYSKFTIKTSDRHQWRLSGVFITNFEHIPHLVLVFLLLTLSS